MIRSLTTTLLLIAVLLLAAYLRFHNLEAQSFWNDEGNSARIAERPLAAIIEGAAGDIHPPAYYVMLAGWRALAGHSEFALRMLSALAGVLTAAVIYALGAAVFDRMAGVVGALFAAVSPFQVYYGQEARMYALVALLAVLSVWLTVKVLTLPGKMIAGRFDRREAAGVAGGFVLVNTLGLYTHYSFPLILLAESSIFLIWLIRRVIGARRREADRGLSPRRTLIHGLRVWVMLNAIPLILFAPWIPTAIRQITSWPRGAGVGVDALGLASTLAYGTTLDPTMARDGLIPLLLLALVGLFPPIDEDAESRRYLRFAERAGLIFAWVVIPVLALAALGAITEPFLKFLLPANLALGLLAARGFVFGYELSRPMPGTSGVNTFFIRLTMVVLAFFAALPLVTSLRSLYTDPAYARDDYRAIAERIRAEAGEDAAVILNAPNQWEVFTYYYPDGPNIAPLPDEATDATVERLAAEHRRIYVLYWGVEQQDPGGAVQRALSERAFEADSEWYGGVRLAVYAVTGGPADSMATPSGAQFGAPPGITLEGYTLSAERLTPGDGLGVTLFWRADVAIDARLKVFVHLYATDGTLVAQHDAEPANNTRPTDGWQVGETVIDPHGLLLPLDAPPGTYQLAAGLYRQEDGARLPVTLDEEPTGDTVPLARISVEQP